MGRSLPIVRWVVLGALLLSACASSSTAEVTVPSALSSAAATAPIADVTTSIPATDPADPPVSAASSPVGGVEPDGFATTAAVVTKADGTTCEVCVWLADTSRQRSRGLMFVTDLGDGVGMAFRYPDPHSGTFVMENTVLPLSIVFFAPDGAFLSSFDMEPCTTETCLNYRTPADFLTAVEVPQGELAGLGIGPGSSFELLDLPCDN